MPLLRSSIRMEKQITKTGTKFIEIFIVFRSVSAYGHEGMSNVMQKVLYYSYNYGLQKNKNLDKLEKLQDEFFDVLAAVNPDLYAKSNHFPHIYENNKVRFKIFRLNFDEEIDLFATASIYDDAIKSRETIHSPEVIEQRKLSNAVWSKITQSLEKYDRNE